MNISKLIRVVGQLTSWLTLALVILICSDVVLRYLFSATKTWVIELEWHLFALIFLMGASYTLQDDQHVRVDVFYQHFKPRRKAWVNLLGSIFFLIPWCLLILYVSSEYTWNSWMVREVSPDPGGLPARYLIKAAIPLGFLLLLFQGLLMIRQNWLTLKKQ